MATLDQTIKIILAGEDNVTAILGKAGSGVETLGGKLGVLNDSVADVTQPFADLAGGILKTDAALTALAVGGLAYAYDKSKDFESASVELKKVVGDIPEDLAAATDNAKELSDTYGEASTSILLSTASFKQAGYDIEDSMTLAKSALDLVIAGDIEAAQSSELLISTLKGFDKPASDATRLIDILNEVSNNYATDVEQLAIGMAELSPIASTMGFSFEETAGILTPVIEIFRSGGEAAVALKTGLLRLVDDNASVVGALESIGVAQKDANGNLRNGQDILLDVSTAFQTLDEDQKLFIASQLVGVEQAARMVTVFDNLSKSTEITATAMNSAGSAAAEVTARLESSEVAVNRFVTGFQNLSITVGDQFREAASEAINGGTDIENALTGIIESGALDELFNALDEELRGLGEFLSDVADNLPEALDQVDFSAFLASLGSVKDELGDLFDGIDLTTPEGLAEAIQLVVDGVTGLANVTSGMVEGAKPFIDLLAGMVQEFIDLDAESQKSIGNVTGFAGALNKLTEPIGSVLNAVEGLGTGIQMLAGVKLVDTIVNIENLGTKVASVSKLLGTTGLVAAAGAGGYAVGTVLNDGINAVVKQLSGSSSLGELIYDVTHQTENLGEANLALAEKYRTISEATGVNIRSHQDLVKAMRDGLIVYDQATYSWQAATEAQRDYEAEVRAVAEASYDFEDVLADTRRGLAAIGLEFDEAGNRIGVATKEINQFGSEVRESLGMAEKTISGTFSVVSFGVEKASKGLKEATEDSDKFYETMLQLASDERIAAMEFGVELEIARLEADSKQAVALIEGIGTTIDSTSSLLGGLTSDLLDASNFGDKWLIEDLINDANDRLEEATKKQGELIDAQIALTKARTEAFESGDALIKVSMDGAMPELEAFVWKFLELIQIRASEEQAEFLTGLGV